MKCLVIGLCESGKTTLCRALNGYLGTVRRTQMIEFIGEFIDTPGAYLENPRFYPALVVSSQQAECVILTVAAHQKGYPIPEDFIQAFSRPVIGVVSKIDLEDAEIDKAKALLGYAGVKEPYYPVSVHTGQGLNGLMERLKKISD